VAGAWHGATETARLRRVDVVDEVQQRGGMARRAGLPRRQVERALREGLLVAPRRGLVADARLSPALILALAAGGVLSCASAAAAHGLDLIDPPAVVHVTVPRSYHVEPTTGVVVHRRDVPSLDGVTTLARTAADCARCLPDIDAVVVIDGVLRRGVDPHEVLAELRGRGARHPRALVARASSQADSSGETCARLALEDAGLAVEPQVFIAGVGRVDLLVEGRVVVEIDGLAYHSDGHQFRRDRHRDAALTAMGYRVLRFTWTDAVRHPRYVVSTVLAVLALAS
jgi:very-short-patch-repair endonuclease